MDLTSLVMGYAHKKLWTTEGIEEVLFMPNALIEHVPNPRELVSPICAKSRLLFTKIDHKDRPQDSIRQNTS